MWQQHQLSADNHISCRSGSANLAHPMDGSGNAEGKLVGAGHRLPIGDERQFDFAQLERFTLDAGCE